jgi:hypothetical protein
MADTKITALAAITTVDPAADVLPIVDISDTSMAASGTTKKITSNQILGAGGTATLASATITGDLTVDTSTLKVDSTNDQVGIGTATPISGSKLDVRSAVGTGIEIQSLNVIDTSPLAINNGGGLSMGYVFLAPSTVIARAGCIKTIKENATDGNYASAMVFGVTANGVATAERMRLDSTGNVKIANGNVVMTTSGTGIDFSATTEGSGTMTSELLNDYEEGTFTPTIVGTSAAGTGTYTTQFGRYTKVGRVVTCDITVTWTAHDGTGNLEVAGLPFSVLTTTNYTASAAIGYFDNVALTAGNVPAFSMLWFNTTKLRGYQYPTGGGGITSIPMDSAGQMSLSITYIVA